VNLESDAATASGFARHFGASFPTLASGGNLASSFGVIALPTELVLDQNGTVVATLQGAYPDLPKPKRTAPLIKEIESAVNQADQSKGDPPSGSMLGSSRREVLAGGQKMSLASAEAQTDLAFILPNDPALASDNLIDGVWARVGQGGDYVVIRYSTGLTTEIRPWPGSAGTPTSHWTDLISEGIPGQVVGIDGTAVFVVPSSAADAGSASFMADGTFVSIIGNGAQSLDELEQLTMSALRSQAATH